MREVASGLSIAIFTFLPLPVLKVKVKVKVIKFRLRISLKWREINQTLLLPWNMKPHMRFRLACSDETLTHSESQRDRRNGVSPNLFAFLYDTCCTICSLTDVQLIFKVVQLYSKRRPRKRSFAMSIFGSKTLLGHRQQSLNSSK